MSYLNDQTLNKLNFSETILWVRVIDFSVNYGHDYINYGHNYVYVSSGDKKIVGKFTVDSVNNSINDIQQTLGNPFDKKPLLNYGGQNYELLITSLKWGMNPLQNDEETFGHFIQYHCDFIASSIDGDDQPIKDDNRVLWDSGNKDETINDINELLGTDLPQLAKEATHLIDKYRFYRANTECPTPSSKEECTHADDIAAVIAGTKPAAVFDEFILGKESLVVLLLKEAYARGFKIETVDNFNITKLVVVGLPYNVRQIVQIMSQAVKTDAVSDYYYEYLGNLLGLPTESINNFIQNIGDFGFNHLK